MCDSVGRGPKGNIDIRILHSSFNQAVHLHLHRYLYTYLSISEEEPLKALKRDTGIFLEAPRTYRIPTHKEALPERPRGALPVRDSIDRRKPMTSSQSPTANDVDSIYIHTYIHTYIHIYVYIYTYDLICLHTHVYA